jgi:NAD(P)-dependent dehydrogenase (short-subunit alcohol dehydrogenase family)
VRGKTVVITGATSGIGEIAALKLAAAGARIVFVARDEKRAKSLLSRLAPGMHAYHLAELSTLRAMKQVGAEIARSEPVIDVLINNAAGLFARRHVTEDGLERTFAINHMAYFVLTALLLDRLKAAPHARIVNTASAVHRSGKIDFDDLHFARGFGTRRAYARSKLCNILFTRELARRLAGETVTANSLHPGLVATRFGNGAGFPVDIALAIARRRGISPEAGAKTLLYLPMSPDVAQVSGKYFNRCAEETPSVAAQSDADAARLWEISEKITAL